MWNSHISEATGSSSETLTVWGPQKHEWESHSQKTIEANVENSQPWNLRKQSGTVRAKKLKGQVWQSLPRNHRSRCGTLTAKGPQGAGVR